ncbi:hypothetical protein GCM10023238_22210 [Streptomyces heliomycini]
MEGPGVTGEMVLGVVFAVLAGAALAAGARCAAAWGGQPWGGQAAPSMRASHADRERAVDVLRAGYGEGRLEKPEFDQRVARDVRRPYGGGAGAAGGRPAAGTRTACRARRAGGVPAGAPGAG